ncbi:DUF2244 domain-containing protein [Elongatibacter sediminis]|uniref:DUF2244 domain-containing protein n=1 Tax=Elongatibacter sediminis TaxID=3119006 RepID=A0AAW9RHF8_9GAMM
MVIVEHSADGTAARIQARANFSLGANGLLLLLTALAVVTLGLAVLLAWQGYWPILAIAVVQLVLVFWVLIRAWQNSWAVEEILIDARRVRVLHRRYREIRESGLQSAWAGVRVESPRYPGYAPRLMLTSRNQTVELGKFLTVEEKLSLAKHLSHTLSKVNAWR